jgi:hypothetical protein
MIGATLKKLAFLDGHMEKCHRFMERLKQLRTSSRSSGNSIGDFQWKMIVSGYRPPYDNELLSDELASRLRITYQNQYFLNEFQSNLSQMGCLSRLRRDL